ncbi:MAG: acyl-CoA dehydrogenase family protein, partial [Mangrovicoccus sp.]
ISLFVVPQFMVAEDGSLGAENDVRCVSIEHKLGIHASPTCTLAFGDNGGALGYLVGEPHRGLEYMFAMMNNARLNVGLQGIGIAEHAYQTAAAYARERKQGKPSGEFGTDTILGHGDIRRMLGNMRARITAARAIGCLAASSLDHAARNPDEAQKAMHQRRADLLIPIVKGWSTEMAVDVASLGVQVHGGMGFVEETGAAQHLRDARITTIYEGTTGIQALDLTGRKIIRDKGLAAGELTAAMRLDADEIAAAPGNIADWSALASMVNDAAELIDVMAGWLVETAKAEPALQNAASVNVLHGFGIAVGAWQMALAAARAAKQADADPQDTITRARLAEIYRGQVWP